jgi:DNA repair photolyase
MELIPIHGRGAADNPPNRFERLAYEPDPAAWDPDDPEPDPRTTLYRDSTRTILTQNDSPDVGFTFSVNPYRGCEHGCSYCQKGDTLILMGDGSTRELSTIREGDEIYGTVRDGWYRRYVRTRVIAHWETRKQAYRVTLADGTELVSSGDHRFLTERGWKHVTDTELPTQRRPHLTKRNKLMGVGAFVLPPEHTADYRAGYLCGIIRGDGLLARYRYERPGRTAEQVCQFRLPLTDGEALARAKQFLSTLGVVTQNYVFQRASETRRALNSIQTGMRVSVDTIERVIEWPASAVPDWRKGFLAGIFDAEGSFSGGILRISNTDAEIVSTITRSLLHFGFIFQIERRTPEGRKPIQTVRICGGMGEHLRFFHLIDPAIRRKCDIEGQAVKSSASLQVRSIEPLGEMPLFDITTGTGDFIANGVVSHNCFARPTHEWLGLSAGLDFETKIFVKEDAPALLREAIASRRWSPAPIAMSGVTDCYQPIERKLRITRGCLEVLAEARNPAVIITKNHLVTRDVDLLGELAVHGAAKVYLSITTLDPELQRVMEPRASTPARRLEAVRTLSEAGVPVGVLVAPVIPGLTDHELPAILAAAAEAGARTAGFVPLRLPYGLAELFEQWLEMHFPQRKEKVLHRIREIRGGKLNDPSFGSRMRGEGEYAEQIRALFHVACRKAGLNEQAIELSTASFRRPSPGGQLGLFDL